MLVGTSARPSWLRSACFRLSWFFLFYHKPPIEHPEDALRFPNQLTVSLQSQFDGGFGVNLFNGKSRTILYTLAFVI